MPEKVRAAGYAFLFGSLAENPWRVGKPLVGEFAGVHSARRAEYRVLYEIDEKRVWSRCTASLTAALPIDHAESRREPAA